MYVQFKNHNHTYTKILAVIWSLGVSGNCALRTLRHHHCSVSASVTRGAPGSSFSSEAGDHIQLQDPQFKKLGPTLADWQDTQVHSFSVKLKNTWDMDLQSKIFCFKKIYSMFYQWWGWPHNKPDTLNIKTIWQVDYPHIPGHFEYINYTAGGLPSTKPFF